MTSRVIEVAGVKVRIGDHVSQVIQEALCCGRYEWATLRALQVKLAPDDVVMELGTGLGVISTYCAKVIGSHRVFTYEANPTLEPYIRDTYSLNAVCPALSMCLLGERDGEQPFYVQEAFWASSTVRHGEPVKTITVRSRSFNHEAARVNPTFLLLDIEGGEYELSRHMDFQNIKKLMIEVHWKLTGDEQMKAVLSVLDQAGFRMNRELCSKRDLYFERP